MEIFVSTIYFKLAASLQWNILAIFIFYFRKSASGINEIST